MKRAYVRPTMVGERFVANEYVAACGNSGVVYKFNCNAGKKGHFYAVKDAKGNVATISGRYMNGGEPYWGDGGWMSGNYYEPCEEKHEAESASGFLTGYHIDDMYTQEDDNISVIIWTANNTNVHCTTNLDMKSWETAKS